MRASSLYRSSTLAALWLAAAAAALAAPPGTVPTDKLPGGLPAGEKLEVRPAMGVVGAKVDLEATLTRGGAPVAGRAVSFKIAGHGASIAAGSATTDTSGKAKLAFKVPELGQESYELTAVAADGPGPAPAIGKAGLGVFKADVKLTVAEGRPKAPAKGPAKTDMSARLLRFTMTRLTDGAEVHRKVKVYLDGKLLDEASSNGAARLPELPDVAAIGSWNVEVIFEGDGSYLGKTAKTTIPRKS